MIGQSVPNFTGGFLAVKNLVLCPKCELSVSESANFLIHVVYTRPKMAFEAVTDLAGKVGGVGHPLRACLV